MEPSDIKPAIVSAIFNGKCFAHFGVNKHNACLYGDKLEDILQVEVTIADDQTKPPAPQNDPNVNEPDYWAWWDERDQRFSLIWSKYFLLNMCFPYGMEIEEKAGKGKAYRVHVKEIGK